MLILNLLIGLTFFVGGFVVYKLFKSCSVLWKNRVLYKRYLTRGEQAQIEKDLDFLKHVIVVADRVDVPENDFFDAVSDNIRQGVKYTFFVSKENDQNYIDKYTEAFRYIEQGVRSEDAAREEFGLPRHLPEEVLITFYPIEQSWIDFPYICYEFLSDAGKGVPNLLMYRGNQLGSGISDTYIRMSPSMANSFFARAESLRERAGLNEKKFVDSRYGTLKNRPSNVLPMRRRNG